MVSLYKRATPSQRKILRIVEGAVLNEADAHGRQRDEVQARSIAKRATGTLTAQMRSVLAVALAPSKSNVVPASPNNVATADLISKDQPVGAQVMKHPTTPQHHRGSRGPSQLSRRSPLMKLWKQISVQVRDLKRSGQTERAEAYIDVLKMIAKMQKEGK